LKQTLHPGIRTIHKGFFTINVNKIDTWYFSTLEKKAKTPTFFFLGLFKRNLLHWKATLLFVLFTKRTF
jgi:hypothetical protein